MGDQSVNVHEFTSIEAAAPFAFNRFKPEFRRARLALDVHMPRFTPIVGVKEKAIPALTENSRHFGNLADDLRDAKPVSSIQPSINYQLPGRRSRRKRGLTLNFQLTAIDINAQRATQVLAQAGCRARPLVRSPNRGQARCEASIASRLPQ